jgi:hypothetical protein
VDNLIWQDSQSSLKEIPKVKKGKILFMGITFVITPTVNGYIACVKDSNGKFGRGATKSMAIGDCVLNNLSPIE